MLKYLLDTLDGLDEALHEHYKEVDGKFVLDVQGGAKPEEVTKLTTSLSKERTDHKAAKDKLAEWGALVASEVLPQLDEIDELRLKAEAAGGKLDEDAIEKLVTSRVNREVLPITRERDKLKSENETLTETNTGLNSTIVGGKISSEVLEAATDAKILTSAIPDIQILAERVFEVDDSGEVVVKDGVGHTPGITAKDFLIEMQDKRPHWWPVSKGGGAENNKGGGGGKNPWLKEHWNMTEQGAVLSAKGSDAAEKMATAAGTTLAAGKPAEK